MSHHRDPVTALGAPDAVGPYSHAVRSGGLLFCSGQTPLDPATGKLVEGSVGDQTRRCLENLQLVCAAAGAELADAVRMGIYVTDMGTFPEVNEAYAASSARGRRRAARSAWPRCRWARRSRSTPSSPCRPSRSRPMATSPASATVTAEDVERARHAIADVAKHTPVLPSLTLTSASAASSR